MTNVSTIHFKIALPARKLTPSRIAVENGSRRESPGGDGFIIVIATTTASVRTALR